jgi:hypothetical protein
MVYGQSHVQLQCRSKLQATQGCSCVVLERSGSAAAAAAAAAFFFCSSAGRQPGAAGAAEGSPRGLQDHVGGDQQRAGAAAG